MTGLYLLLLGALLAYHLYQWFRVRPYRAPPPAPACPGGDLPLVSFLVPAWKAAADIPAFVAAYRALEYPAKELILCAGGADGSLAVARRYAGDGVSVLEQTPTDGKQTALAKSFAASRGELIYLTDIDCRPDSGSVLRTLRPVLSGQEAVVTGSSVPSETQVGIGAVLVHWATVRKVAGRTPRYLDGLLGRNCAVTREAVEAIGGFRYAAATGTDYRMAQELQKKGYRIWFEPESEVETEFAWPLGVYVRKRGRWLRNVLLYAERPRQLAELRGAALSVAIPCGLLVLLGLAAGLNAWPPAFVALVIVLHGLLNRLRYVRETLPPSYLHLNVLTGSALNLFASLAAGLYALVTCLSPSLRKNW